MPGNVPPVADEREGLLRFLEQQRDALRITAHGLTEEQARATPTPSVFSVGGLVKHVTGVERQWIAMVLQRDSGSGEDDYEAGFRLGPGETLAGALEHYRQAAEETEAVIARIADLGRAVPVPKGVPWFPDDVDAWSVRWVLLH